MRYSASFEGKAVLVGKLTWVCHCYREAGRDVVVCSAGGVAQIGEAVAELAQRLLLAAGEWRSPSGSEFASLSRRATYARMCTPTTMHQSIQSIHISPVPIRGNQV